MTRLVEFQTMLRERENPSIRRAVCVRKQVLFCATFCIQFCGQLCLLPRVKPVAGRRVEPVDCESVPGSKSVP